MASRSWDATQPTGPTLTSPTVRSGKEVSGTGAVDGQGACTPIQEFSARAPCEKRSLEPRGRPAGITLFDALETLKLTFYTRTSWNSVKRKSNFGESTFQALQ